MDRSQLIIAVHGIVGLLWFSFGTLGLQEENMGQAGIGFGLGLVLIAVGMVVAYKFVEDEPEESINESVEEESKND